MGKNQEKARTISILLTGTTFSPCRGQKYWYTKRNKNHGKQYHDHIFIGLEPAFRSVPGIRRLISNNHEITLWNRTLSKAKAATEGLTGNFDVKEFTPDALKAAMKPGDIAVSMLPATMHIQIAEICLDKEAHFVSSSYVSPEMAALDDKAKAKGPDLR